MPGDYPWGSTPFRHQLDGWLNTRETEVYALFWEQGCGKTKPTMDTAAWLFLQGEIDAMLVLAPGGVHRNWAGSELDHLHPSVRERVLSVAYEASRGATKSQQHNVADVATHRGLAVLSMPYSAFRTELGKSTARKFLERRKCLYVLDEAHYIKTPSAKISKLAVSSSRFTRWRRMLTGTPIANSPFDIYMQVKFLNRDFWKQHGLDSYAAFKSYFGIWEQQWAHGAKYPELKGYQRLDELAKLISPMSNRVTKDEVLDLPPKLYSRLPVDLAPAQRRAYDQLVEEFLAELDDGRVIEAPLAAVRLTRLQQVVCGYLPGDDERGVKPICDPIPRLRSAVEYLATLGHSAIVWARFTKDLDLLARALDEEGLSWTRYDGTVTNPDKREEAVNRFQAGSAQFFLGNQAAQIEGRNLTAARTVLYYSNSHKMVERLQSEDRAHRIGQEHPVSIVDVTAEGTVDEKIISALRSKWDVASRITGDKLREWLR